jgi:hypothetical protein
MKDQGRETSLPLRVGPVIGDLNLSLLAIMSGEVARPIQGGSPLQRGKVVEYLDRISPSDQQILYDIRRTVIEHFSSKGLTGLSLYLYGGAARIELRGDSDYYHDLDILIVGIVQELLVSDSFIHVLSQKYRVEKCHGSVNIKREFLKIFDKTSGRYIADLDVPFHQLERGEVLSPLEATLGVAYQLAAIEILDGKFQAVSAYYKGIEVMQGEHYINLPLNMGGTLDDITAVLRYPGEVVRTTYFTVMREYLNTIREWWFNFRRSDYDEEHVTLISEVAKKILMNGFAQAEESGMSEEYFSLLVYTGALWALFPASWVNACSRLFTTSTNIGKSIYEYLGIHGYTLENLDRALSICMETRAWEKINQVLGSLGVNIPDRWHVDHYISRLIESALLGEQIDLALFIPGKTDSISIAELISGYRPSPELRLSPNPVDQARYLYWNIAGLYVEAFVYAEILRSEVVMKLGYKLAGIEPLTSAFDRSGLVYQRVNMFIQRAMCDGTLRGCFREAMSLETLYFRGTLKKAFQRARAASGRQDAEFLKQLKEEVNRRTRFNHFFVYHVQRLAQAGLLEFPPYSTQEIFDLIVQEFNKRAPQYQFVFD